MNNYHLTKNDQGTWNLKREGAQRATQNFAGSNKVDAIRAAAVHLRQAPESSSLKIHGVSGRIQEERTYPRAADPSQSPG